MNTHKFRWEIGVLVVVSALLLPASSRALELRASDHVVMIGGFKTCRGSFEDRDLATVFPNYLGIAQDLRRNLGQELGFTFGCFGIEGEGFGFHGYFKMTTSRGEVLAVDLPLASWNGLEKKDLQPALDLVAQETAYLASRSSTVHWVGYSYGGWTVLQALIAQAVHWASLTTVDPIDPTQCNPAGFVETVLGPPAGCVRAPSLAAAEGAALLEYASGKWVNLYQKCFRWVHSGPFGLDAASGPREQELKFNGGAEITNSAHRRMLYDPRTWQVVREQITGAVQ